MSDSGIASVPRLDNDYEDGQKSEVEVPSYKVHWFRSTSFQVVVVGMVFFCAPGMYNALSSLGAGGLASPWYANATAAAGYVFMAFFALIGGIIVSKIGPRLALLISSTGDVVYGGSLYLNSKNGTQWFLMLGSIWSGVTDGLMYSVEGAIITGYPEPNVKGRMLGLWVFMRSIAPCIGGAIILGMNSNTDSTGGVSLTTYIAIIAIMCCGPFFALLLSAPEKVQRKDGKKVEWRRAGWSQATKEWWRVATSKDMLLLCPLFFTSWFYGSYIGTLQTQYMTVRTRALCSFAIPWGDILGGFLVGAFLDWKKLTVAQRARWSFIVIMTFNLALWIWTAIITKQLEDSHEMIDWTSGSMFSKTFSLFIIFDAATMMTQTALFWIVGKMSDDFAVLSYMTGTLRAVESAGQAVAYGIKSTDSSDWISVGMNIGLIVLSLPFAWMVIRKIGVVDFEQITFEHATKEHVDSSSPSPTRRSLETEKTPY
ncbi:MFS general substrate transporter [Marasmius fiardii PR-910]|nr:MFS general substrate transporter [Marasmius fiardii PR-910]